MATAISTTQQVQLSAKFSDRRGRPAQVDGRPEWSTDKSDVLMLSPTDDGLSCVVAAAGPLGTARVTMTADADLGDGVKPLIGFLDVEVTPGEATVVEVTAGSPEEQPEV
jgi:hypothetical protein